MVAETTPQSAFGTAVTWDAHDIGYMTSVDGIGLEADIISYLTHDSRYRQKLSGPLDAGQINIGVKFITGDTTGQKVIFADIKTGTERQLVVTFPDATTWTVNAIAKKIELASPPDDTLDATITIECTGEPAFSEE